MVDIPEDKALMFARLLQDPAIAASGCTENCGCNEVCGCKKDGCCEYKCGCDGKTPKTELATDALAGDDRFRTFVQGFNHDQIRTIEDFQKMADALRDRLQPGV